MPNQRHRQPKPLRPGECFDKLQALDAERAEAVVYAVQKVRERFIKRAEAIRARCTDPETLARMVDGVNTEQPSQDETTAWLHEPQPNPPVVVERK